jgi:hypothetical protein
VDSQHRCAVAHAAAELSELQNRTSALSDLVPREVLRRVLTDVANELRDRGALDEATCRRARSGEVKPRCDPLEGETLRNFFSAVEDRNCSITRNIFIPHQPLDFLVGGLVAVVVGRVAR